MFIDITVFGRSAEIANQYLSKGRRVLIEGRLVFEQWVDPQGQKRSKHSIVAERVQFMDSKASSDDMGGGYQAYTQPQQPQPQVQTQPTQNPNQNIPTINIDEEEIPF
jgi:single-strand DNA-binding protein